MIASKQTLVVAAVGCIVVGLFAAPPYALAQGETPTFEPSPCPIDIPDDPPIDCGYLHVAKDHANPEGATIQLPVIIIHSRRANPASDPILFTEGGPSFSSLSSVWWLSRSALVDDRDVIILEQRGNLYAQPNLACDTSVWWLETAGETACLDSLNEQGIDLALYTTQQIVADIEALRQALAIETWNLYGSSYSTRLMLLTMREHPEAVRSVILDSVNPPHENRYLHDPEHADRVLQKLFDDCAADVACAAAYPDLEEHFYELFSRLNADPVEFTIAYDNQGHRLDEPLNEEVNGYTLVEWMVSDAFYGPTYAGAKSTYLPLLIDQVAAGNIRLLYPWLVNRLFDVFSYSDSYAWGLYFAVNCQNDFPAISAASMQAQTAAYPELEGYIRHAREIEICELWDLPAAPLDSEPVASDIPALVLAGGYDPITPPAWGQSTAAPLSNGYYYEFPAAGHGVIWESECARDIQLAFLANPGTEPDASCVTADPIPQFVVPDDVIIAPGFYNTIYDINLGNPQGKPWLETIIIAVLFTFPTEIIFLLIAGVISLFRRQKPETPPDLISRIAHPLAGLASILGLSFPFLLTDINNYVLSSTPTLLYFGLPAGYPSIYIIGIVALTFTLLVGLLLIFAVRAWLKRYWSLFSRILFSLVTLAGIIFMPLLIRWELVTLLFKL